MSRATQSPPQRTTAPAEPPRFVRVTGTRDGRFVEFEFSIGDPELAVELILPFEQFREFCARQQVSHLSPEEGARLDFERMKWRFGAPGIDQ